MTRDEVIVAVAQGWCAPENENKTMDTDLAMAIVENVMRIAEGPVEGTYTKEDLRAAFQKGQYDSLCWACGLDGITKAQESQIEAIAFPLLEKILACGGKLDPAQDPDARRQYDAWRATR